MIMRCMLCACRYSPCQWRPEVIKTPSQLCDNVVNEDINIDPEMIADEYILLMECMMCRHALLDFVTCVSLIVQ